VFQPMAVPCENTPEVASPEAKRSLTPAGATSEQVSIRSGFTVESHSDQTQSASQIISSRNGTLEWLTVTEATRYLGVQDSTASCKVGSAVHSD
jgi:hypothetical protein